MTSGLIPTHGQIPPTKPTARRHVVAVLTQEILKNSESGDFPIASEHQLCRRFQISRVTVRLALSDLQHRGLIYRRHGKGTYAHGGSNRAHRNLAVLIQSPDDLKRLKIVEIIRGVLTVMSPSHSSLVVIHTSPDQWPLEMAGSLTGVVVIHQEITDAELMIFKKRNLPFLRVREPQPAVTDCDFFAIGQQAAQALNYAAMTGEPLEEIKV